MNETGWGPRRAQRERRETERQTSPASGRVGNVVQSRKLTPKIRKIGKAPREEIPDT